MDLFELFENDDNGERRQRRAPDDQPPRKGIRGLFQRLASSVRGEDEDDEPRRRNDGYGNDGYRNDGYRNERRNRDRGSDWDD